MKAFRIWSGLLLAVAWGLVAVRVAPAEQVRFDDHRVVRVTVENQQQLERLLTMTDDVWSDAVALGRLDVRMSPEQFQRLAQSGLSHSVLIENLQERIEAQRRSAPDGGPFDDYMKFSEVLDYLDTLVALRPDLAQTFIAGQTIQGRDIVGICVTGAGTGTKPAVLCHGCQHAREWITVPVALWVADKLVREYDTNPIIHELVDRVEWYVIPVVNADGYVYSWIGDRTWRKNRRSSGGGCWGVDLNRNWGYEWGGVGSSPDPCAWNYHGTAPFSEPETQALRDFIIAHPNLVAYTDLYSYGQCIFWPWGYTSALPPHQPEFTHVSQNMSAIMESVHGEYYRYGPLYTAYSPVTGVSVDWVYGDQGLMAYIFELRDKGQYGFLLPPEQIIPNCEEVFPALLYLADHHSAAVHIAFPDGLPELLAPGVPHALRVRVTAANQPVAPGSPTLHVRTTLSGEFVAYPMTPLGGDDYEAVFPPRDCDPPTEFYVSAAGTGGGVVYAPRGAPGNFHEVPIGTATILESDNFETHKGWTVQNENLQTGAWVRVDPNGTFNAGQPAQPEDDNPAGTGTFCYVTDQGPPGGGAWEHDVDGGPTRLTSPRYSLSTASDPFIGYYRWFYNSTGDDLLIVEVSNDDGVGWVEVERTGSANSWLPQSFRLRDYYTTPSDLVRLRFTTADNPNNSITEAGADDVVVSDVTCTSVKLAGDTNCDGVVNFDDIDPFVVALSGPAAYFGQYPNCLLENADVNGDGAVDFADIDPFVALLGG